MPKSPLPPPLTLPLLLRPRHTSLWIPIQQLLPVRHVRRENHVDQRREIRGQTHDPQHRRPKRVREQIRHDPREVGGVVVVVGLDGECAGAAEPDGEEDEDDEEEVQVALAGPEHDDAATPEGRAVGGFALGEFGFDAAGRGEGHGFAAEEAGEEEGADDGEGVVGGHPHVGRGVALGQAVAGGEVGNEFVDAGQDEGDEGQADLPAELVGVGVGDEGAARDEDDGDGEQGDHEADGEEGADGEDEAGEALEEGHVLDDGAPEAEVELHGGLQGAQCPACSLFQVAGEGIGDGSVLEALVNKGGLPAGAEEEGGGVDVFCKRARGPSADGFEGCSANGVAASCAPGDTVGILGRFHDVYEGVEGLHQRIVDGDIIEELWRAHESHFGVVDHVCDDAAQPVWFGNHICIESGDELAGATWKYLNHFGGSNEIACLEVMGLALNLDPSMIVEVRVFERQSLNAHSKIGICAIVTDNDSEARRRIVLSACGTGGIENDIDFFLATCDKDIHCW